MTISRVGLEKRGRAASENERFVRGGARTRAAEGIGAGAVAVALAVSLASIACSPVTATGAASEPRIPEEAPLRGTVVTHGPTIKAVRAGPAVIHAFSAFAGGDLYTVPAATGTDADCLRPRTSPKLVGQPIEADRRVVVSVGAGELACLSTATQGSFELLWHAHEELVADASPPTAPPTSPPTVPSDRTGTTLASAPTFARRDVGAPGLRGSR
jgi:hypothetical protein